MRESSDTLRGSPCRIQPSTDSASSRQLVKTVRYEGDFITAEVSIYGSIVNRRAINPRRLFPNTCDGGNVFISFHYVYVPAAEKTWKLSWIYMESGFQYQTAAKPEIIGLAVQESHPPCLAGNLEEKEFWAAIFKSHYIPYV